MMAGGGVRMGRGCLGVDVGCGVLCQRRCCPVCPAVAWRVLSGRSDSGVCYPTEAVVAFVSRIHRHDVDTNVSFGGEIWVSSVMAHMVMLMGCATSARDGSRSDVKDQRRKARNTVRKAAHRRKKIGRTLERRPLEEVRECGTSGHACRRPLRSERAALALCIVGDACARQLDTVESTAATTTLP